MFKAIRFSVFILSLLLFGFSVSLAQEGQVMVFKDARVDVLLDKYKEICVYENTIDGFRVQIFFDAGNNSQSSANTARTEFLRSFSDTDAYIIFEAPYYKVRVGDFRTRIEAYSFYLSIQNQYPNAFIVRDKISYPRIY